jgi:HD-GYP domain-containing protein (c-di-GMP phosphodiesterase class II)
MLLDVEMVGSFADLFARIIDFRSPFTFSHSRTISVTAGCLAGCMGFSASERRLMRIAGLLHDLGKLAVPNEILEKNGPLDAHERNVIKRHAYHTWRVLETVKDFDLIKEWGALHHERLDGKGYPFHRTADELTLGSRVMAVADVFTALTEERPYRRPMSFERALGVLEDMAEAKGLDAQVVWTLRHNEDKIESARRDVLEAAADDYQSFREGSKGAKQ